MKTSNEMVNNREIEKGLKDGLPLRDSAGNVYFTGNKDKQEYLF
jgi:hypothetical protein